MQAWQLILTIFGVVGIVVGGVVKVFATNAPQRRLKEQSGPKAISTTASQSDVHGVDVRVSRLEERMNGVDREIRDLKRDVDKNEERTGKLSELLIEWIERGRRR